MSCLINPFVFAVVGGGGVDPTDLANLELWLPVSALSGSDGDQISTWEDQSGNNRDATGVIFSSAKPKYRTGGGPSSGPSVEIGLGGSFQGNFTLPNFASGFTSGEIFLVIQAEEDPGADTGVNWGSPAGDWGTGTAGLYPFSDNVIYENWGSTVRKTTNDPTTALTSWLLYNIRSASGAWSWSINAATSGNDFFSTGTNTVAFSTAPLIGRSGTRAMKGRIVDVIMYSRVLDDATERKPTVHQYLNDTYGFSLPTS